MRSVWEEGVKVLRLAEQTRFELNSPSGAFRKNALHIVPKFFQALRKKNSIHFTVETLVLKCKSSQSEPVISLLFEL